MKTRALLLLFSLRVFYSAAISPPGDGTSPLKEYVDDYVGKVTVICQKIQTEQDPVVVKSHAEKLMSLSDEANKWLNSYYTTSKSHQLSPSIAFIGKRIVPAIISMSPALPSACSKVNGISDVAAKIRFVHNTKPVSISKDVEEISDLTVKLRNVVM
jgi:hypothetical protein